MIGKIATHGTGEPRETNGRFHHVVERMRVFRSDKMATTGISRIYNGGSALALQRSIFRENCSKFLTFVAR